jgi:CRISPR-associated protein Cmr1
MWVRHMPAPSPLREWPTIAECVLHDMEQPGAITAWDRVIERFRHFRQGVGRGRNQGQQPNRPGRSRYPEPEAIRTVLYNPQTPWQHERMEHIPNDAFPRAELGLPIVFHFQGQGEPPDTVLYPDNDSEGKKRERMASPLILKPLALASGKAVPLILRLQTPALTGVDLRRGETSLSLPPTTVIRDPRLAGYQDSPLAGSPNGSAIEAFIAFARTEGFTEVTR